MTFGEYITDIVNTINERFSINLILIEESFGFVNLIKSSDKECRVSEYDLKEAQYQLLNCDYDVDFKEYLIEKVYSYFIP